MAVYVVIQSGVYRHGIGGVFSTEQLARAAAIQLLAKEPDKYHSYEIVRCELDTVAKFNRSHPEDDVIADLNWSALGKGTAL
jgi:hypothetical protein